MNGFSFRTLLEKFRRGTPAVIRSLPLGLPAALAVFSLVLMSFVLVGRLQTWLVLPIGLAAALATVLVVERLGKRIKTPGSTREKLVTDILVLVGVSLWMVCNIPFTGQHIFTDRDPATYNNTAVWLVEHDSLVIPKPASAQTLQVSGLKAESLGFWNNVQHADRLDAQGAHLLPALLGLLGRIVGKANVLHLNVLFGAAALLAMYGFASLVARPRWAGLTVVVMGLSLPMIYFSRDSYTEPLTMAFMFGGLTLLHMAIKTHARIAWLLAGLTIGAAAMARIDAYMSLAGLAIFVLLHLAITRRKYYGQALKNVSLLVIGTAVPSLIGWLDITRYSTLYYMTQRPVILQEFMLLAAIAIAGGIFLALHYRYNFWPWLHNMTVRWRVRALWVGLSGFFLLLLSRPLWHVGYLANGGRSFSEQTMNWIWWYMGPFMMVLGIVGLVWVLVHITHGRKLELLAFMCVMAPTALLYLVQPNITGDQPWAVRRLLPIVLPGFVLLGLLVMEKLYNMKRYRLYGQKLDLRVLVPAFGALAIMTPLVISYPFMLRRLYVPQLSQVQSVCAAVPAGATVVWVGDAANFAVQPTRNFCNVDAVGLALAPGTTADQLQQTLQTLSEQAKGTPLVVGMYDTEAGLLKNSSHVSLSKDSITYGDIEHSYKRVPRNMFMTTQTIYMGTLVADKLASTQ